MKKYFIHLALAGFMTQHIYALEFNEVGHKAFGMGGVGVAVKNSPYGLFFNPALLGAKPGTKIGYSAGISLSHKNIFEIVNQNLSSIADIAAFNNLLQDNAVNAKGQFALALQLPEFKIGNFAIGYVNNIYAFVGLNGFLPTNQNNVDNANISFDTTGFSLAEIPIAYSYKFETPIGDLSAGVALKYMNGSFVSSSVKLTQSFDPDSITESLSDIIKGKNLTSSNFGIDLGVVYAPIKDLSIGVVGKNLNSPTFSFGDQSIKVRPQARLGIGYEITEHITLAADADLTNNDVLSFSNAKLQSQKLGLGVDVSYTFFSVRAGVAKDIRQDNGAIISAGIGFGILDLSVAASTSSGQFDDMKIPRYIALQLGGGFVF